MRRKIGNNKTCGSVALTVALARLALNSYVTKRAIACATLAISFTISGQAGALTSAAQIEFTRH